MLQQNVQAPVAEPSALTGQLLQSLTQCAIFRLAGHRWDTRGSIPAVSKPILDNALDLLKRELLYLVLKQDPDNRSCRVENLLSETTRSRVSPFSDRGDAGSNELTIPDVERQVAGTMKEFVFFVEDGFTMQAFSSAIEVLRVARKLGAEDQFSYSVVALENCPVFASNGIAVLPDRHIDDLPRDAVLIVVSGAGAEKKPNHALLKKLRFLARQGFAIWAISSGVVRLAQAGLIDGCKVAAHWEDVPYLKEKHPKVEVSTSLFIADARHPTCSGGGAAADLMLSFIQRSVTAGMVEDIASRLIIDGVRDGKLQQSFPAQLRYTTANSTVFAAIRLMEANCFDALTLHEVARNVGVSQRQLERLFQAEFRKTPANVYLELRLTEARQEVLAGHRPLIEIALDFGFQPGNFSKVYRRIFGVLPSEDRK